jgi:effector-binding domain-containing protein
MITGPKVENRTAQPYVAIRTQVAMAELPTVIPELTSEVYGWLDKQSVAPAGESLIRYLVIDMTTKLDIELGVLVETTLAGDGHITADILPAGRYATLIYTGDYPGLMNANKVLLDWGAEQGLVWDTYASDDGDGFGARYERYIRDPANEPDPAKWETEVAIRLADEQSR